MEVFIGLCLFYGAVLGLAPATIAYYKGHSFLKWWFYGAMLWIVALPASIMMEHKLCPRCGAEVRHRVPRCKQCDTRINY